MKKSLKKLLTNIFLGGIVLLVLKTRANKQQNFRKTSEKVVDKIRQN